LCRNIAQRPSEGGLSVVSKIPWGGRFRDAPSPEVVRFTESISIDHKLFAHDIEGSKAHATMLARVGLLSLTECEQIVQALTTIEAEIAAGRFVFSPEREDIHMHIEAALIARLGDVGRKLHTARSRNDQVSNDLRHWTRDAIDRVLVRLGDLQSAWVDFAGRHSDVVMPGYTHMQRAQPVLAAHYALAHVEKLERDRSRLLGARARVNVLALGAAALAGTSLPIDREVVAGQLGFAEVGANSLDLSSDRDFAVESVFAATLIAEHLSGWAEEWVLWSTQEFGFLSLPDSVCTGSSIMPQKRNPDVCELIRGKCARVIGALMQLLVLIKGLPLAYNRDLQEDKRPLFDAFETVESCLALATLVISGATLNAETIRERLDEGFLDATTLMEWMIARGVPQRTAHEVIGKLVAVCEERGCRLLDLSESEFHGAHGVFREGDARLSLGVDRAVEALRSYGSSSPDEVARQLRLWRERLAERGGAEGMLAGVGVGGDR
jgi:argininosuccinate lyase